MVSSTLGAFLTMVPLETRNLFIGRDWPCLIPWHQYHEIAWGIDPFNMLIWIGQGSKLLLVPR